MQQEEQKGSHLKNKQNTTSAGIQAGWRGEGWRLSKGKLAGSLPHSQERQRGGGIGTHSQV